MHDPEDSLGSTVHYVLGRPARDASSPAAHFLVPVDPPGEPLRVGNEPVSLGRAPQNTLRIDDPGVSARHCVARLENDVLWVEDLGSTNGTQMDGRPVVGRTRVPAGSLLQLGHAQVRHELRDERVVADEAELSGELQAAAKYITDLLPEPWRAPPVEIGWSFVPSRRLGGDSLGYAALDADRTALYLIDVCGHGPRAALHSVSILNTLRQRTLAADYAEPAAVLAALNAAFPMDAHGGMFFTLWYGVLDRARRRLRFASGGHPPALLREQGANSLRRLATRLPPIGAVDEFEGRSEETELAPGARLYLFSDGVFEEPNRDGQPLGLRWLERVVAERAGPVLEEPARIEAALRAATGARRFQDDFTLLVAHVSA